MWLRLALFDCTKKYLQDQRRQSSVAFELIHYPILRSRFANALGERNDGIACFTPSVFAVRSTRSPPEKMGGSQVSSAGMICRLFVLSDYPMAEIYNLFCCDQVWLCDGNSLH